MSHVHYSCRKPFSCTLTNSFLTLVVQIGSNSARISQLPGVPDLPAQEDVAQLIKFVLQSGGCFNVKIKEAIRHLEISRCPPDIRA